jgi:hypothetical protein
VRKAEPGESQREQRKSHRKLLEGMSTKKKKKGKWEMRKQNEKRSSERKGNIAQKGKR